MTDKKERVTNAIFKAIDAANKELSAHEQVEKNVNTVLMGDDQKLDSLGFVIFFTAVEDKIEEEFGSTPKLEFGSSLTEQNKQIKTVGALIDYITSVLDSKEGD